MSHNHNQCHSCGKWYEDSYGAVMCFFSHDNSAEDNLPEENSVEKVCALSCEVREPGVIMMEAIENYSKISHTLLSLSQGGKVKRPQLLKQIARVILSTTQLCYLFTDVEEMNYLVEEEASDLGNSLP